MTQDIEQPRKRSDLIFDVGMHKGEDTDYYLRKGFHVVSFEADPALVMHCKERFRKDIEDGRLTIVEGAVIDSIEHPSASGIVRFHRNKDNSVWGTVMPDWAERNEGFNTSNEIIEVPVVDFRSCLMRFGVPHYLKIDIEGLDTVCLRALMDCHVKPDYVSIESEKLSFSKLQKEFDLFEQLGYTSFQAVNQAEIGLQHEPEDSTEGSRCGHAFQFGSSGLFGTDLRMPWLGRGRILLQYRIIFLGYKLFGDFGVLREHRLSKKLKARISRWFGTEVPGWYDTHARHGSVNARSGAN